MNIFKEAIKKGITFDYKGSILPQDLYNLKLEVLDQMAVKIDESLGKQKSFLNRSQTPDSTLSLKLNILKEVIADRLAEQEKAANAAKKKAKNEKINAIIAKKQDSALENMSIEDLEKLREE